MNNSTDEKWYIIEYGTDDEYLDFKGPFETMEEVNRHKKINKEYVYIDTNNDTIALEVTRAKIVERPTNKIIEEWRV